jgi:hypothetical protein
MPSERDLAKRLDRDLNPAAPRFFELMYARIYRPTSHVAHYGLGAAKDAFEEPGKASQALTVERTDEDEAAEMLGLALVTYAALLEFGDPILRLRIAPEVAEAISAAHEPE